VTGRRPDLRRRPRFQAANGRRQPIGHCVGHGDSERFARLRAGIGRGALGDEREVLALAQPGQRGLGPLALRLLLARLHDDEEHLPEDDGPRPLEVGQVLLVVLPRLCGRHVHAREHLVPQQLGRQQVLDLQLLVLLGGEPDLGQDPASRQHGADALLELAQLLLGRLLEQLPGLLAAQVFVPGHVVEQPPLDQLRQAVLAPLPLHLLQLHGRRGGRVGRMGRQWPEHEQVAVQVPRGDPVAVHGREGLALGPRGCKGRRRAAEQKRHDCPDRVSHGHREERRWERP